MYPASEKRFVRVNRITIFLIFAVILAGSVVRSTGSGMGCPDWPKCFNRIVPPTHVDQLPEGYEEHYIEHRAKKNERFANILEKVGINKEADLIRHDESLLAHEPFNAAKTWTEYGNRLFGVLSGIGVLLTLVFSFTYIRVKPIIFIVSLINLFALTFQAWFGSIVVSTNLTPWVITVHMLLAIAIACMSIYTFYKATTLRNKDILINHSFSGIKYVCIAFILLLLVQVVWGTQVREEVDVMLKSGVERNQWLDFISSSYMRHRIFGYICTAFILFLFWLIRSRFAPNSIQSKSVTFVFIFGGLQLITGVILGRYNLPAFAQPLHLLFSILFFTSVYYLMLLTNKATY